MFLSALSSASSSSSDFYCCCRSCCDGHKLVAKLAYKRCGCPTVEGGQVGGGLGDWAATIVSHHIRAALAGFLCQPLLSSPLYCSLCLCLLFALHLFQN